MTVYCFSESSAMSVYIAMKYLKATHIVRFELPTQGLEQLKTTLQDKRIFHRLIGGLKSTKIETLTLGSSIEKSLEEYWSQASSDDVIIMPSVTAAQHVPLLAACLDTSLKKLFVEPNGELYYVDHQTVQSVDNDLVNLKIKDFIAQCNGKILTDNSELFRQPVANLLLDHFIKNMKILEPALKDLRPMKRLDQGPYQMNYVSPYSTVDFRVLSAQQRKYYTEALELLNKYKIIQLTKQGETAEVFFRDTRYREYFSKAGTWFEHLTQRTLDGISDVKNVLSSVFFTWDDELEIEKNEIDIMAVYENKLITISCKATNKLTDDYLYELESHSDYLSDDTAIMVLATTVEPSPIIRERADRLGVHLVVYKNSQLDYKNQFVNLLNTYKSH